MKTYTITELNEESKHLMIQIESYSPQFLQNGHPLYQEYLELEIPKSSEQKEWINYIFSLKGILLELPIAVENQPDYFEEEFLWYTSQIEITPYSQRIEPQNLSGLVVVRFASWDWENKNVIFNMPFQFSYENADGDNFSAVYKAMQETQDAINYVAYHY